MDEDSFILNGIATGGPATRLMLAGGDPGMLRPFLGKDGRSYVTRNMGVDDNGEPVYKTIMTRNNTAVMRKDDWIMIDEAIMMIAKPKLKIYGDLKARGLSYSIPNGMGVTVLQTERMSDITPAITSMNGVRRSDADQPVFDILNFPLPLHHKDIRLDLRTLMASRRGGSPLDTSSAKLATVRVAEQVELLGMGTAPSYAFGGGTIYGYTNFPGRITGTGVAPTNSGWTPDTTVQEVLGMKQAALNNFHHGPFKIYYSVAWDQYMGSDYNKYLGKTLNQRLLDIGNIESVEVAEFLTSGYQMIMVEQDEFVARAVEYVPLQTVQWETDGGFEVHLKILMGAAIQLRVDQNNNTGIVHYTQV